MQSPPRRYRLKNNGFYFQTGRLPDRMQVVMGTQGDELVLVRFSSSGEFRCIEVRQLSSSGMGDEKGEAEARRLWQREIHFRPGTVRVGLFFIPDRWIGIRELPDHYQEVVDFPEQFLGLRKQELEQDLREWKSRGDFVFYWV